MAYIVRLCGVAGWVRANVFFTMGELSAVDVSETFRLQQDVCPAESVKGNCIRHPHYVSFDN